MRDVRYWEHLRRWRHHAGLSLETAAGALGRQKQWLSRVERGIQPLNVGHLLFLLELYSVRWEDFLTNDDGSPDVRMSLAMDARSVTKVKDRLMQLPPADVRLMALFADALADRGKNRRRRNRSAERLLNKR